MQFNANEIREARLPAKGIHRFRVMDAREKRSQNGNDMLNLKLSLSTPRGEVPYWTRLILMPQMFWQMEHFCDSTGMSNKIEEGCLMAQDCMNAEGYIEIDHKINKDTGEIEAVTKDFLTADKVAGLQNEEEPFIDDDIPL